MSTIQTASEHLLVRAMKRFKGVHPNLNAERISLLMALGEVTGNDFRKALEILVSDEGIVANVRKAKSWRDVRNDCLSYAEQVANTYPMPVMEVELAERRIKELCVLLPEEEEAYFVKEYDMYLFPELEISFSIKAGQASRLGLSAAGEYRLG